MITNLTILQVITDTDRRGAQVFALDLQSALEDRGRIVRTVALQKRVGEGARGLDVSALGHRRLGYRTICTLQRELRVADVVIGHGSSTLAACAIAGVGSPIPFVYRQISDQLFWANTLARRTRVRAYLRRADAVVALWSGAAEVLANDFGVPAGRIHPISNGVPAARFPVPSPRERTDARARLGLVEGTPTVLSIGALVPEKGVDLVIRAVSALRAQLLVVGDGPERMQLEGLASNVAPGKVHFVGSVSDPRLAYAAADVVALASRGGDSVPAVLIEAGLSAVPAVATDVGGIETIVVSGSTGALVEPENVAVLSQALERVAQSPEVYGRAARDHCLANFDIEVVATAWERVVDGL